MAALARQPDPNGPPQCHFRAEGGSDGRVLSQSETARPGEADTAPRIDGGIALAQEKTKERLVVTIHSRRRAEVLDLLPENQFRLAVTDTGRPLRSDHDLHQGMKLIRDSGFSGYVGCSSRTS